MQNKLDATAAAGTLGVSVSTLERWRSEGQGPPFERYGRSVRYDEGELETWAAARSNAPSGPSPRDRAAEGVEQAAAAVAQARDALQELNGARAEHADKIAAKRAEIERAEVTLEPGAMVEALTKLQTDLVALEGGLAIYDERLLPQRAAALQAAAEAEAGARRRLTYEQALEVRHAAVEALCREYPQIEQRIADLRRTVARAELAIDEANRNLPNGASRILEPEAVRDLAFEPRMELGEPEPDARWAYVRTGHFLSDDLARNVRSVDGDPNKGMLPPDGRDVVKVRGEWVTVAPEQQFRPGPRLRDLSFPALHAGQPTLVPPPKSGPPLQYMDEAAAARVRGIERPTRREFRPT